MAELITVYSCDDCGGIVGLKTDEDWQRFNDAWTDSLRHQFCPDCKEKRENRALMELDLALSGKHRRQSNRGRNLG